MIAAKASRKSKVAGWIISILAIIFLSLDSLGNLAKPEAVVKRTVQLGFLKV